MGTLGLTLCGMGECQHKHTEICGENGVFCKHECNIVEPRRDEITDL